MVRETEKTTRDVNAVTAGKTTTAGESGRAATLANAVKAED